tara:strand:- start:3216 stop:3341 length:126 start_codon:yes stop_codon:yes gene_type:complete
MNNLDWTKPLITEIGSAEQLIQRVDVDGSGDGLFPANLASE